MMDAIYIGTSGLNGFSEGLKVISNNAANMNTPGYKGSSIQFGNLFYSGQRAMPDNFLGAGLGTFGTTLNFSAGELSTSQNPLDLAIDGQGLFVLRTADGQTRYTRDGEFVFGADGILVSRTDQSQVVSIDSTGKQGIFDLNAHQTYMHAATSTVKLTGTMDPTAPGPIVINGITLIYSDGSTHTVSMTLTRQSPSEAPLDVVWEVKLKEAKPDDGSGQTEVEVGKGTLNTMGLSIDDNPFTMDYTPALSGATPLPVTFDFSRVQTGSGSPQNARMDSQDGYPDGTLTSTAFDNTGTLVYSYSNGKTFKGDRLLLARFDTIEAVKSAGTNQFESIAEDQWHFGVAGDSGFGTIRPNAVELSNVNLSQEFSDLVIMQRGYQASSQVISTANEMLQQLFSMNSSR